MHASSEPAYGTNYVDLCNICFKPTGIQCILLDDGLGGVASFAESNKWHDQFTISSSKRIARIETEAEEMLPPMYRPLSFDLTQRTSFE